MALGQMGPARPGILYWTSRDRGDNSSCPGASEVGGRGDETTKQSWKRAGGAVAKNWRVLSSPRQVQLLLVGRGHPVGGAGFRAYFLA